MFGFRVLVIYPGRGRHRVNVRDPRNPTKFEQRAQIAHDLAYKLGNRVVSHKYLRRTDTLIMIIGI